MIRIYGKEQCSFCDAAKRLLDQHGIAYEYSQLGLDFTKEELSNIAPHARTFPQIFLDEINIGGYQDLVTKIGMLAPLTGGEETLLG